MDKELEKLIRDNEGTTPNFEMPEDFEMPEGFELPDDFKPPTDMDMSTDMVVPKRSMEVDDVEIKSTEVQEILGKSPNWLISTGILMVGIVTIIVLSGTYVIKYPDIVKTEVTIATKELPASVIAKQSGKIIDIVIKENDSVVKGQYLGLLENTANKEDVDKLKVWLNGFEDNSMLEGTIDSSFYSKKLQLGAIQNSFYSLQKAVRKSRFILDQDAITKKKEQLTLKILQKKKQIKNLKRKNKLKKVTYALAKKKFYTDKRLYKEKVLTEQEFDNSSNTFVNARLEKNQLAEEESNQNTQLKELQFQYVELDDQGTEKSEQIINDLETAVVSVQEALKTWEETYVLKAGISGVVSFYKFWTVNQEVKAGDEVMVVIPNTVDLFAYSDLPAENSGKVEIGQKVKIELKDFPAEQYGSVAGKILFKSSISRDGKYFLKIDLPNGLITRDGKKLKFSQEMKGSGDIVTKDMRLLERLFYKYINDLQKFVD